MTTVTVFEKFHVVIPKSVRDPWRPRPSQKLEIIVHEGRAEFVPIREMKAMRGFPRGIGTRMPREKGRL